MLAQPARPAGRRPVVVGAVDTPDSMAAIEWAAAEAARRNVPLRLVHALEVNALALSGSAWAAVPLLEDLDGLRVAMDAMVAVVGAAHPGVTVSGRVAHGDPVAVLGDGAEVLVLGAGHGGHRGLRPSWRSRLIKRSTVPVVSVSGARAVLGGQRRPRERVAVIARSRQGVEDCVSWVCARAQRRPLALQVRLVLDHHDYAATDRRLGAEGWLFDLLADRRRSVGDAVRLSGTVTGDLDPQDRLVAPDLVVVSSRLGRMTRQLRRIRRCAPAGALAIVPAR